MLSGLLIFLGLSTVAFAQTPILFYNFNNGTGTTAASTGSANISAVMYNSSNAQTNLYTASGTGVTGLAGDYAFNSNATGMGYAGSGGYLSVSNISAGAINGLDSFTLTGWFNTESSTEINNSARLFDFTSGNNGFLLDASAAGTLSLNVDGTSVGASSSFSATNSWVFFAATYDGTSSTNNVNFYEGTLTSKPTLVGTASASTGAMAIAPTGAFQIGGNSGDVRSFQGDLDDMGVYGSGNNSSGALTLGAVDALYAQEVPEPNIMASFLLGGILLLLLLGRKQRGI